MFRDRLLRLGPEPAALASLKTGERPGQKYGRINNLITVVK